MTIPRLRPGRRATIDPSRPRRNRSFELFDDQVAWLDSKTDERTSRSRVLRDLIDRWRAAEMVLVPSDTIPMTTEGPRR